MQFNMRAAVSMFLILAVTLSAVESCFESSWVCAGQREYRDACFVHVCRNGKDYATQHVAVCTVPLKDLEAQIPPGWFRTKLTVSAPLLPSVSVSLPTLFNKPILPEIRIP